MISKLFVFLAYRRTGSNYLMKMLDSFDDIEFFGEVFHWDTVWIPIERKKDYVKWLKENKNVSIDIGEKAFEDKELVTLNHKHPQYFLDFLSQTTSKKYAGFKIFPEHLSFEKLKNNILSKKNITKIILKRNLLDVYVSDKTLAISKQSQGYTTDHIKIKIDCQEFYDWYLKHQTHYMRLQEYLISDNQEWKELAYEDIHQYSSDSEKATFVHSWLVQQGFDVNKKMSKTNLTKKQDRRQNAFNRVENPEEWMQFLEKKDLHFLTK